MDNLDDIKQIWLSASVADLPTSDGILKTIKKFRLMQGLKTVAVLLIVLFLIATMCWVLFAYHSHFISTRIGEIFMFIAMFILLSSNIRSLKRISDSKIYSNSEYLNYLKREKLSLFKYQKVTQKIGFAFACIGLLLYLYEGVYEKTTTLIVGYAAIIAWCAFTWFILRPMAIKRKTKKLTELIAKLETYSKQLTNEP